MGAKGQVAASDTPPDQDGAGGGGTEVTAGKESAARLDQLAGLRMKAVGSDRKRNVYWWGGRARSGHSRDEGRIFCHMAGTHKWRVIDSEEVGANHGDVGFLMTWEDDSGMS